MMGLRGAVLLFSVVWVLVVPGRGRPADSAPKIPETQADNPNVRRIFAYPEPKDIFNRLQKGSKLSEKYLKKGKESYKSKGESTGLENELQESVHKGDLPLKDLNSRPLDEKAKKEPLSPTPQQVVDEAPQLSIPQRDPTHTHQEPSTDLKGDVPPVEATTIHPPGLLFIGDDQDEEPEVDRDILVFEEPLTKPTPGIVLSVITPVDVVAAEEVQEEPQTFEERIDEVSILMGSKPLIPISDVSPEKPQPMASIPLDATPTGTESPSVAVGVNELSLSQVIPTERVSFVQKGEEDPITEEPEMTDSPLSDPTTLAIEDQEDSESEALRPTTTDTVPFNIESTPELVTQILEVRANPITENPAETGETATPLFPQEVTPEVNSEATQVNTQEETPEGSPEANPEGDEDTSPITQETPTVTEEVPRNATLWEARDTTVEVTQEESSSETAAEEDSATTTTLPQPMVDPIELMFKEESEPETDLILNDTFI